MEWHYCMEIRKKIHNNHCDLLLLEYIIFTASRYAALLIPHSPGAVNDLSHNSQLAAMLQHFITEKSKFFATLKIHDNNQSRCFNLLVYYCRFLDVYDLFDL